MTFTPTDTLLSPAHMLRALAQKDPGYAELLISVADLIEAGNHMTPKQAQIVLWRLKQRKVIHDPSEFYVALRPADDVMLAEMPSYALDTIWPALLDCQRTHIMALRAKQETRPGLRGNNPSRVLTDEV